MKSTRKRARRPSQGRAARPLAAVKKARPVPKGFRRIAERAQVATIGRWARLRIFVIAGLLTVAVGGITYRAYGLQVQETERYRQLAARQHLTTVEVPAPRGNIYDATGKELAVNANVESVYVNPRAVVDLAGTAEALSKALSLDVREVEARLASTRYFAWIERHITEDEAARVRALELPGVDLAPEPRRFYPGGTLAGNVLGLSGIDGDGLDGVELTMDDLLTGQRARSASLRDASGSIMVSDPSVGPVAGSAISLTLHRTIQYAAEQAITAAVREHQARSGIAVVMDVDTGDILAMASTPMINPNEPAPREMARNRAITDTFEIGSVMKVFTVAQALEKNLVEPDTVFDIEGGRIRVGGHRITDSFHDDELTVAGILKRSSNVGASKLALLMGAKNLHQGFVRFGFGRVTGVELPGEQAGVLRSHESWREIGLATHSFGYGMTATPLQVTAAMAAVGSGGIYRAPRLIKEVRDASGEIVYRRKTVEKRVIGEDTAHALWAMLESVFDKGRRDGGTAKSLDVPGFRVGGKTGTAHKLDPETKTYAEDLYLSSFCGLAPIDDPKIAVLVVIDEPHGEEHYGAKVAGPAWVRIVSETLPYLGITASAAAADAEGEGADDDTGAATEPTEVAAAPLPIDAPILGDEDVVDDVGAELVRVPDFSGMSMTRVLEVAREASLPIDISGSGKATHQYPPPGLVRAGTPVRIVFRHAYTQ